MEHYNFKNRKFTFNDKTSKPPNVGSVIDLRGKLNQYIVDINTIREEILPGIVCPHSYIHQENYPYSKDQSFPPFEYFFVEDESIHYYSVDGYSQDLLKCMVPKDSSILIDDSISPEVIIQALRLGLTVTKLETKLVTFI